MLASVGDGRIAVVADPRRIGGLAPSLVARLGEFFDLADPLGARVCLLSVAESKGLEFDGIVLCEPAEIARRVPRGENDLYVALSRATQRLAVVYETELTPELAAHLVPEG
jgi:hypothetical protein